MNRTLSRRAERLLYATNSYGRFALRNEKVVDIFSAKVICSSGAVARRCPSPARRFEITLSPAGRRVPFLPDFICAQIADEFQPKLQQYRLTNFCTVRTPEIDVSELTAPMQDVARALGSMCCRR